MHEISRNERRRRLAARHHLATPAASATTVAGDLVGLHSTDPTTVYLSLRARVDSFGIEDLDVALYDDRSLLRTLGMRRTMFVVPRELAAVIDAACTQRLLPAERRRLAQYLEDQQVTTDGERWISDVAMRTLAASRRLGPATAKELTDEVPELATKLTFGEGKTWGGQVGVSTRILYLLSIAGKLVRGRPLGTWLSSQYRWVSLEQWVPEGLDSIEPAPARADLVRRWLSAYGPGSLADIAWWTGWGRRLTSQALADVAATEVAMDGSVGFVLSDDVDATQPQPPWVALLPSLDSTVMGWKERDWYLGKHAPLLFDRNGNAGPTVWVDGRVVGGWTQVDAEIRYRLLEDVAHEEQAMLDSAAYDLGQWLGEHVLTPRFRTPLEKELSD